MGKVDPETGEIVPTGGKGRKKKQDSDGEADVNYSQIEYASFLLLRALHSEALASLRLTCTPQALCSACPMPTLLLISMLLPFEQGQAPKLFCLREQYIITTSKNGRLESDRKKSLNNTGNTMFFMLDIKRLLTE